MGWTQSSSGMGAGSTTFLSWQHQPHSSTGSQGARAGEGTNVSARGCGSLPSLPTCLERTSIELIHVPYIHT